MSKRSMQLYLQDIKEAVGRLDNISSLGADKV